MATPDFYNENINRAFPFLRETVHQVGSGTLRQLPDGVIADAGFVIGAAVDWNAARRVYLNRITRIGATLYFEFTATSPSLHFRYLVFTRSIDDPDFTTEFTEDREDPAVSEGSAGSDSTSASVSASASASDRGACDPEPLWSGYLVTGKLSAITALLPGDGDIFRGDDTAATLEPALVQATSYVSALRIGNQDRTRVTSSADCEAIVWPYPVGADVIYIDDVCIRGNVRFVPGYNSVVRQEDENNAVVLGASVGAGDGTPPANVPLFDGEVPPEGSILLDGSLCCNGVIRSINGVGGRRSNILTGLGVSLVVDAPSHSVTLTVDMSNLANCPKDEA